VAAAGNLRPFGFSGLCVAEDLFQLLLVDLRARLGVRRPREAGLNLVEGCGRRFQELVVDVFMDKCPRSRAAYLSLIEKDAQLQAFYGLLPGSIREIIALPSCFVGEAGMENCVQDSKRSGVTGPMRRRFRLRGGRSACWVVRCLRRHMGPVRDVGVGVTAVPHVFEKGTLPVAKTINMA